MFVRLEGKYRSLIEEIATDEGVQPHEVAATLLTQKLDELSQPLDEVRVALSDKGSQVVREFQNGAEESQGVLV